VRQATLCQICPKSLGLDEDDDELDLKP